MLLLAEVISSGIFAILYLKENKPLFRYLFLFIFLAGLTFAFSNYYVLTKTVTTTGTLNTTVQYFYAPVSYGSPFSTFYAMVTIGIWLGYLYIVLNAYRRGRGI
jgi:hypothetical protein